MKIERIFICTSRRANLYRAYSLITGEKVKNQILNTFRSDLENKLEREDRIFEYNQNSLIQEIPYKINRSKINSNSYLKDFNDIIQCIIENKDKDGNKIETIEFKNSIGRGKAGEITNFQNDEGIKFLIVQEEKSLYLLKVSNNTIIKNRMIMSLSITKETTLVEIPRGIQVPTEVTARIDRKTNDLFVYNVDSFEKMLTLNENVRAQSKETLDRFRSGEYTISTQKYKFDGIDDTVEQELNKSIRSLRRLSKYQNPETTFTINKIKKAINKLDKKDRVEFDDKNKRIKITPKTVKTFVAIIHNGIVERLISGDVELII